MSDLVNLFNKSGSVLEVLSQGIERKWAPQTLMTFTAAEAEKFSKYKGAKKESELLGAGARASLAAKDKEIAELKAALEAKNNPLTPVEVKAPKPKPEKSEK